MTGLVFLSALLLCLAVFWSVVGNKISFSRAVRYKDERIDSAKVKRSSRDVVISLSGSVICAGIALAITGTWYYTIMGLSGGYFALKWWRVKRDLERMELLRSQFVDDVLNPIESATRGGLNPYQAIEDAVPDMPRPARDIFYEIMARTRTGETLAEAIDNVRKETGWDDLKVLYMAMNLYNRIGCKLDVICENALDSYEEKESTRSQISAAIAQNMMTLKVLTALPFVIVGAARTLAPAFSYPLFHTVEGGIVFAFTCCWIALGNIIIRRMVRKALGVGV